MNAQEALQQLDDLLNGVRTEHESEDDLHRGRLDQLAAHGATLRNTIESIYDEDIRHRVNLKAHYRAVRGPAARNPEDE